MAKKATFIQELTEVMGDLDQRTHAVLAALNPRSARQMSSILRSFPNLGESGALNLPKTSDAVARVGGAELRSFRHRAEERTAQGRRRFAMGAAPPKEAAWQLKREVPIPETIEELGRTALKDAKPDEVIDHRGCPPWPVRDQGQRGTCVSFAATALREALDCALHQQITDLSEQFLYWAIKNRTADPEPGVDGTYLEFAREALQTLGICEESSWPYDSSVIPGNVSHDGLGQPTQATLTEALDRARVGNYHEPTTTSGNAQTVLSRLRSGTPVAVSLPVFVDPLSGDDNSTTDDGLFYGDVVDPVPTSHVDGGHAVCVTGFVADPDEASGGYFVIRNSWGTEWGTDLPEADYHGPEPGYGQISATYIDQYLWEVLSL